MVKLPVDNTMDFDNDLGEGRVLDVANLKGKLYDVLRHRALLTDSSKILIMILVPKVPHPIEVE